MHHHSRILIFSAIVLAAVGLSACRSSRSNRYTANRNQPPAPTAANPAAPGATPSAQAVLTHADSALERVNQLSAEDRSAEDRNTEPPPRAGFPEQRPNFAPMRTPWGAPYTPQPNLTEYGLYEAALGAYNGRRYDEAIALFSQIVTRGRPPELVPNAYYWMGESFYAMGEYAQSMPYFEYVTRVGPEYKRTMALYKLTRAALYLGNRQEANMYYERLRNEYPHSQYIHPLIRLGAR
ncbi:MAG: tetratricopeptide repeat protein [Candidatus Kapaibacterium sp.]